MKKYIQFDNIQDQLAVQLILTELENARKKHPDFTNNPFLQLSILVEEVGEVAKDLNDKELQKAVKEMAQVAAVIIRMITDK